MKIILVSIVSILMVSCAADQGTSTGNPLVSLKFDSFNSSLALSKTSDVEATAVSSLKMCFKRLRFKKANEATNPDPELDEDNIDFFLGDVSISSLGTALKSVQLPMGVYKRIEIDLDDKCSSDLSVQLTNSTGSYDTDDRITIRFEGTFNHNGNSPDLTMNIQAIVSALNTVTSAGQIKSKAQGVNGTF